MSEVRLCEREGCELPASTRKRGLRFCSFACRAVDTELSQAQRLCSAIGSRSSAAGEMWAAAAALNDALSDYQQRERALFSFAQSVGIGSDEWYGIKRERS